MIYPLQWQGRRFDETAQTEHPFFPVEVPGNIQYDYAVFRNYPNPYASDHSQLLIETEDWYWEYRTELTVSPRPGEHLYFVAKGIDYIFDIQIGGKTVLSHEGMFSPIELDITDLCRFGDTLSVILHPHPKATGPYREPCQMARNCCKPCVQYGFDFQPRLVVSGLWKEAYLETRDAGYIRHCEPFYTLNPERTVAKVHFEVDCDQPVFLSLKDPDGNTVYEGTDCDCVVNDCRLWWCNGHGQPNLYHWTAKTSTHTKSGTIGFKTVKLVENGLHNRRFPATSDPVWITLELNGVRLFAKGANVANMDVFPGRVTDERCRELVDDIVDANMNLVRIQGWGGLRKDAFYEACDRRGIMVWQEFPMGCNDYPNDAHYLSVLEQESTVIIRSLRHHAALVLWCGGNELFNWWSGMDLSSLPIRLTNKLAYELDQKIPYLATSPSQGMTHGYYHFTYGDENVFQIYKNSHSTAYVEFAVPSFSPIQQLKKVIPADEISLPQKTKSWLNHQVFGVWAEDSWGALSEMERLFGTIHSTEEAVAYSQWLQSAGLKECFEEMRRQWPVCSMAVLWSLNEPWPTAANNAIIAYPNVKKPAYFAVKKALEPVLASAKIPDFFWKAGDTFSLELWLLNDSDQTAEQTITATLHLGNTSFDLLTWHSGTVEARTNKQGDTASLVLPCVKGVSEMTVVLHDGETVFNEYRLSYKAE